MSNTPLQFTLATMLDYSDWKYGSRFFQAVNLCDPRLMPSCLRSHKRRTKVAAVEDARPSWGALSQELNVPETIDWEHQGELTSFGSVAFRYARDDSSVVPGRILVGAAFDPRSQWLGFFRECCVTLEVDAAILHLLSEEEGGEGSRFYCPIGGRAMDGYLPNIGWATYFGKKFVDETNWQTLKGHGFHVEKLGDGYLVLLSEDIADCLGKFSMISHRRAELKRHFRASLFERRYEPGDPSDPYDPTDPVDPFNPTRHC
jgi:hypothetical protein